jgi:hypothetical protein
MHTYLLVGKCPSGGTAPCASPGPSPDRDTRLTPPNLMPASLPEPGQIVIVRQRPFVVSDILETAVEKCGGWRSNSAAPVGSKLTFGAAVKFDHQGVLACEVKRAGGRAASLQLAPPGVEWFCLRLAAQERLSRFLASCRR